ncbi:hypothetical protein Fmac_023387 [Flemingia macrophylla]|uniref:Cysteine-rich receptor-like protein kinase n=1 Tax=Flemingia macrophylla TaxID=520843 RepID=A0ABD1LLC6_9FABA
MPMVSRMSLSLCILFILISISESNAQPSFVHVCDNDKGNYTANSTYQNNLNTLLSNLSSNTNVDYGFYNFSYGQKRDRVNAIGLCRGDLKPDACRSCLNDSRVLLTQLCPNQKEAIGWQDNCMLRYSNRSIFGTAEDLPSFYLRNNDNASDVDKFNEELNNMLESLTKNASLGDSHRKFAAADVTGPAFQTIWGLVQCTPDLSELQCSTCLVGTIAEIPQYCDGRKGGRIVRPSCYFRYETHPFYDSTYIEIPSPPPAKASALPPSSTDGLTTEVVAATNNFSSENKLGEGGFGPVYKGRLSNGQEVAVKRLSRNSPQGDIEFKNEVLLVAKLQHRNLVKLLGFCLERRERLLVGYMAPEYVLHGQFSVKSDVFSFGVLVLEILSGQKNSWARRGENVGDLLTYAWQNWREGTASNIVDPTFTNGSRNEMMRYIHVALLCVQNNVDHRPTMASVALMLNSYSFTLPLPSQPAFFPDSRSLSEIPSEEYDPEAGTSDESNIQSVQASVNEASITDPFPR